MTDRRMPGLGEAGILGLAALALSWPVLSGRLLAGHDVATYLMYAVEVAGNARAGFLLPAWAPDLNGGFGGPGLLLYPPLVNALHGGAVLAGLPAPVALGLVAVAGLFLSGLAAILWLKVEGFGAAALPAALVYMAAPYRMVDLYERTNLSEHWAFVFPPLILASASLAAPRGMRFALAGAGVAGLLLTNTPLSLLFGILLAAWFVSPEFPRGARLEVGSGALLGFGLAAFLLIPQSLASRWTATELWYGPMASAFRPVRNTLFAAGALDGPFNLRVSMAVAATAALAAAAFAAVFLAARAAGRRPAPLFWAGAALAALLLTLPPAGRLWEAIPLVSRVQFPWRLGAVLTLALAALVARIPSRTAAIACATLSALAALPFVGTSTVRMEAAAPPLAVEASPCTTGPAPAAVAAAWGEAANPWMRNPALRDVWYVPRSASPALVGELFGDGRPVHPSLRRREALVPAQPEAPLEVTRCGRLDREVAVTLAAPGLVVFRSFVFPWFEGSLDGRPVVPVRDPLSGLLSIQVPAGSHRAGWTWKPSGPVALGRRVSAVSLAVGLAALLGAGLRVAARRRPAAPRS